VRPWLGEIVVFVTFVCFAVENRKLLSSFDGATADFENSWQSKNKKNPISLLHLS